MVIGKRNGCLRKFLLLFEQLIEIDESFIFVSIIVIFFASKISLVWLNFWNITFD